jgi:membrane-associated phospholipid phosphatase
MKIFVLFLSIFIQSLAFAEEAKLPFSSVFTSIPATSKEGLSTSFSKDALPYWGVILGSTALLYQYDEEIYSEMQKKGRDWRIGNQDNTKSFITVGGQELLRLPTDTGSTLYFLGDGWMHTGIALGFVGYGSVTENNRAYNTGLMIIHGMFVSTIFNQALKRSFGRESPEVSTSKRGSWNLFPSFNDYNSKTASYDAMPTGHVMTATMTFTIISERYPEYNSFIYPFGGLWISALMFEMMNNGVHWASDYPLGIAMGYVFGKASVKILSKKEKDDKENKETSWMFIPSVNGNVTMLNAVKSF